MTTQREGRPNNHDGTANNKSDDPILTLPGHEPTFWLRAALQHALQGGQPCQHLRAGDIGTAALWAPGKILCTDCADALILATAGTDQDHVCDRCGELHRGELTAAGVRATPNLVVAFGLCPACWTREAGPAR